MEEIKKLIRVHDGKDGNPGGIEIIDDELYKKVSNCNLSPSMANSFLDCPADWLLDKYILPKLEHEEPIYFARGTAFHKVMERFFTLSPAERVPARLGKLTIETLKNDYPDLYKDSESVEWIKDAIRQYVRMGFNYQQDIIPNVEMDGRKPKIGLELFVSGNFGTKHKVLGFVDKLTLQNTEDGKPKLVMQDWKTGKAIHNYTPGKPISWQNSFDYWRQQTLYSMMLEQQGIHVDDASLIFPVANGVVHVDWQNKDVQAQAIKDMQDLDRELCKCIDNNFFPFTPKMFCNWCDLLYTKHVGKLTPPKINPDEFEQYVER